MDSLDLNTRLPPRKRLLAGLKKDSLDCNLSLQIPLISSKLYDRLHKVINSSSLSQEEIIEEVNSVASDAAEAAEAARVKAVEKAAVAAKAKANAKSALELLDLIRESQDRKFCGSSRKKSKKRRLEVKNLYENDEPLETDEALARKLHRVMNSSPRISKSEKRNGSSRKLRNGGDDSVCELDDKVVDFPQRKRKIDHSVEKQYNGSKIVSGKKIKSKRKKLLLSQFNVGDRGKHEELLHSELDNSNSKPFNEHGVKISSIC